MKRYRSRGFLASLANIAAIVSCVFTAIAATQVIQLRVTVDPVIQNYQRTKDTVFHFQHDTIVYIHKDTLVISRVDTVKVETRYLFVDSTESGIRFKEASFRDRHLEIFGKKKN